MTGCNPEHEFIINEIGIKKHIELRTKDGEFIKSICCKKCVKDLELIIKKFKKRFLRGVKK